MIIKYFSFCCLGFFSDPKLTQYISKSTNDCFVEVNQIELSDMKNLY